jgi:cytochrome c oxidase subunit 2
MFIVNLRSRRIISFAVIGAIFVLMLGCTPSHNQSTFDPLGPVAANQLFIFNVIFWVAAVIFVAVEGALIYMFVKFRRRPGDEDPKQVHGNTKLEIAWTVIPALILVIAAVPTIDGIFFAANPPPNPAGGPALEVDAIGRQWFFEFQYADPNDPSKKVVFANELHMPVAEPVVFRLDSRDVIHSFWVPKLGGKVDMVPNNDHSLWLQADDVGEFYGQCAEFCGVSHANMRFKVIVESRADFNAWLQEQAAPAAETVDPLALAGKDTFRSANCIFCHSTGRGSGRGPNLSHVASRLNLVGLLPNAEEGSFVVNDAMLQENLKNWLTDPDEIKPGNIMSREADAYNKPEFALNESDVDALVAYLMTLK